MSRFTAVNPAFFEQPTQALALALLGKLLVHESREGPAAGRIVEVEMYRGPEDRGAHSYGGKPTERTRAMYGPPGHAYIYFIYGMYYCMNVVAAPEGSPEGILLRALEPVFGVELMRARRRQRGGDAALAQGPGRLTQAMGITGEQYGVPLWTLPLYIAEAPSVPLEQVRCGPRINLAHAGEAALYPWRFWDGQSASVSRPRQGRPWIDEA